MICPNDACPDRTIHGIRGEYRPGITECPRCGAPLVDRLSAREVRREDDEPAGDAMSASAVAPVVVGRCNQRHEAELLRSVLAGHGIQAFVDSDDCGSTDPALGFARQALVLVGEADAEEALAVLATKEGQ